MNQESAEKMMEMVKSLEGKYPERVQKKLDLAFLTRMLIRLDTLSPDCQECHDILPLLDEQLRRIAESPDQMSSDTLKRHKDLLNQAKSHLLKVHKLVTPGYYTGIYMSLGMSLGLIFGMIIFDNLALGLPIGLAIGLAIGASQDAEAKKNDRVI